jgi:hypothetical protein
MDFDPKTLLFSRFTPDERREMLAFCELVVLAGKVPSPLPSWCTQWLENAGHERHNDLLMIATALPQRVMLSLLLNDDPYIRVAALGGALNSICRKLREIDPKAADEALELVRVNS